MSAVFGEGPVGADRASDLARFNQGRCQMLDASPRWKMENEKWKMENGKGKMSRDETVKIIKIVKTAVDSSQ